MRHSVHVRLVDLDRVLVHVHVRQHGIGGDRDGVDERELVTVRAQLRLRVHDSVHERLHVLADERDPVPFLSQDVDRFLVVEDAYILAAGGVRWRIVARM